MRVRRQFDHFEIQEELGAGGMGAVYRALDLTLPRPVALKLLKREHSESPEFVAQFQKEAAITASINHPHVVKVFTTADNAATMSNSGGMVAVVSYDPGTKVYPLLGFSHPADARSDSITVQMLLDHQVSGVVFAGGHFTTGIPYPGIPIDPDTPPPKKLYALGAALMILSAVQYLRLSAKMRRRKRRRHRRRPAEPGLSGS